jgi:hypothetical protein
VAAAAVEKRHRASPAHVAASDASSRATRATTHHDEHRLLGRQQLELGLRDDLRLALRGEEGGRRARAEWGAAVGERQKRRRRPQEDRGKQEAGLEQEQRAAPSTSSTISRRPQRAKSEELTPFSRLISPGEPGSAIPTAPETTEQKVGIWTRGSWKRLLHVRA